MEPLIFFFFFSLSLLVCTPPWSEDSLFSRKKREEDQSCGEETGRLIIARSKSSGNKSHVTCVGIHLMFSSVWRLFDLLSLSYHNELFGLSCSNMEWAQQFFFSSLSVALTAAMVVATCLGAALICRIIPLFCSAISTAAALCINERVEGLFSLLESSNRINLPQQEWRVPAHQRGGADSSQVSSLIGEELKDSFRILYHGV